MTHLYCARAFTIISNMFLNVYLFITHSYIITKTALQVEVVWCYMLGLIFRNEGDMISKKS